MTKEELFGLMEQIAEEREAARPVAEKLASGEEPIEDIEIPEGWRTAGMVLELCERSDSICEVYPARALPMLQLALSISHETAISDDTVVMWLKGHGWSEMGYTHTEQGWYQAAFRAFDAAENVAREHPALAFIEAKAKLRRAAALGFVRRCQEAISVAEDAGQLFATFGDERRVLSSEMAKAIARYHAGDLRGALVTNQSVIAKAETTGDSDFLARLHINLACVYRDLGDASSAASHYERAKALSTEIGNSMQSTKVDWGLARVRLAEGNFAEAEPMFRKLRGIFVRDDMVEDAGLVALDLVEILVETNRCDEARAIIEQVITDFTNAQLNHHAVMAIGYLRDLLSTTRPVRHAIMHVRTYVEKLKTQPALLFLPLEN